MRAKLKMRPFLFLASALAAAPPNIVYLVIDDWGWSNFAPHRPAGQPGNDEFLTPKLAALASEGLLFERMYAHKFCGPSRVSLARIPPKTPACALNGAPQRAHPNSQPLTPHKP